MALQIPPALRPWWQVRRTDFLFPEMASDLPQLLPSLMERAHLAGLQCSCRSYGPERAFVHAGKVHRAGQVGLNQEGNLRSLPSLVWKIQAQDFGGQNKACPGGSQWVRISLWLLSL